jgi:hypothetical protein
MNLQAYQGPKRFGSFLVTFGMAAGTLLGSLPFAVSPAIADTPGGWTSLSETLEVAGHTATLLPNGNVLMNGGTGYGVGDVASAEIYDVRNNSVSSAGMMTVERHDHTTTLLGNGEVIVAGGLRGASFADPVEIYRPDSAFSVLSGPQVITGPIPDFAEIAVTDPPAFAQSGNSFTVTEVVQNQGLAKAGASTSRYYLSHDTVYDPLDTLLIGSRAVPPLEPGDISIGPATVMIPPAAEAGTYFLLACANDDHLLAEGNLSNNCTASPNHVTVGPMFSLEDLGVPEILIGLVNTDDIGTKFDLQGEVYKNASLIASGELIGVSERGRLLDHTVINLIPLSLPAPVSFFGGDTLSIKLSMRITCTGGTHASGRARFYYTGQGLGSHFDATFYGVTSSYFLRDGFGLGTTPDFTPKTIDLALDSKKPCPTRPYTPLGTWSITLP